MKFIIIALFICLSAKTTIAQTFVLQAKAPFFGDSITTKNTLWFDADNDEDMDLLVTNLYNQPNVLYINNNGRLSPSENNIFPPKDGGNSASATCADVDADGDLDVLVCNIFGQRNYFYENEDNLSFAKKINHPFAFYENNAFAASFIDIDADADADLFLPDNEFYNIKKTNKTNKVYINYRNNFEPALITNLKSPKIDTRAALWADTDNDGDMDVYLANFGSNNQYFMNNGDGTFTANYEQAITKITNDTHTAAFGDIDNDADQDLLVVNVKADNEIYLNDGKGNFTRSFDYNSLISKNITGTAAFGDFDFDGYTDLYATNIEEPKAYFYKSLGNDNNYLNIKLRGAESNRFGVGATIKVFSKINNKTHIQTKYLAAQSGNTSVAAYDIHFGLNKAIRVDSIKVIWPNGNTQIIKELGANKNIIIEEGLSYFEVNAENLPKNTEPILKDLSLKIVADSIMRGAFHSVSIFCTNNGIAPQKPIVQLQIDKAMQMRVSYPKAELKEDKYIWILPELKAGEMAVITSEFLVPANITTELFTTKATIFPILFDRYKENNSEVRLQNISK